MKHLTRLAAAMLLGTVVVTMASCLGDDNEEYDNYYVTAEEYGQLLSQMEGDYQSKLYFYNEDVASENKVDSAVVATSFVGVGDPTVTVSGIPASCLARLVKDEAAKTAVEQADDQTITGKFYLYQHYQGRIVYVVVPQPLSIDVNYGGEDHKVVFTLAQANTIYGEFVSNETVFDFRVYNIKVDDKADASFYYPTDVMSILRIHAWK